MLGGSNAYAPEGGINAELLLELEEELQVKKGEFLAAKSAAKGGATRPRSRGCKAK